MDTVPAESTALFSHHHFPRPCGLRNCREQLLYRVQLGFSSGVLFSFVFRREAPGSNLSIITIRHFMGFLVLLFLLVGIIENRYVKMIHMVTIHSNIKSGKKVVFIRHQPVTLNSILIKIQKQNFEESMLVG